MDKLTVMDFERDGRAWIGRSKNKTTFNRNDIDDVINKLKELTTKCIIIK